MGLTIVTSHRLEHLLDALLATMEQAPLDPMIGETVLVPGQGIARWLELRIAERLGVAAGLDLPFLGSFLQRLCTTPGEDDPFEREVLVWRLWRLLRERAQQFGPAAAYLRDDPDGLKRLQLCRRIARCFDDYQLYRDDVLAAFAEGDDQGKLSAHGPWQAALWRALLQDAGHALPQRRTPRRTRTEATPLLFPELADLDAPRDPRRLAEAARRLAVLNRRLDDPAFVAASLPPRLSVFGATTLAPALLALLQRIGEHVPVQLYVPSPTPHHVGDLRPRRTTPGEHALLARFGTESREFQDRLLDVEHGNGPAIPRLQLDEQYAEVDPAHPPPTLLHCLQTDLVAAFDRSAADAPRFALSADDPSLRVHDCHGPQRELEVVRDQICRAFADDPSLQPRDCLVLVPDIDRYAPYAYAVFGPWQHDLPFHVADRHPARELPLCRTALDVLDLVRSRSTVADVLHPLETAAVQRRFGLFPGDVPQLRHLCREAGIRWGRDAATRERHFHVPAFADNAWQQGLERLLLGSLTGPVEALVLDRAPVGDVTESRAELLQRFVGYVRTLFAQLDQLERPRPLAEWADALDDLQVALFAPEAAGEDADGLRHLQRAAVTLRTQARIAKHDEPVAIGVLRAWLDDALAQGSSSRGFLGGSITIAAMLPMRAVPVRCLHVCGLDDASFPRRDRPSPFDLIAAAPRRGDRSRRDDDLQLFLDLLLAARDRLHLTFVGHSAKDNAEGAPSVVLTELLDHIDRTCEAADGRRPREHVLVQHPLQPWSPRYRGDDDPRLFTWRALPDPGHEMHLVPAAPWCPPATEPVAAAPAAAEIAIDDLLRFWWHPNRTFLRESLRLRVRGDDDAEDEDEPFVLGGLDRYRLQDDVVRRARRGESPEDDPLRRCRAQGRLPVGSAGDIVLHHLVDATRVLEQRARNLADARSRRLDLLLPDVDGAPVRLFGELDGFHADTATYLRAARSKAKDHLRCWLRHLLIAVQRQQPERSDDAPWPTATWQHATDGAWQFLPLASSDAVDALRTMVRWYRIGQRRPIEFFENASYAAGKALHARDDDEAALRAAQRSWPLDEDRAHLCDLGDPDIALCMRDRDPFGAHATGELIALARLIWLPAIGYRPGES